MDYNDYILDQYYKNQEENENIYDEMEEQGLDYTDEDTVENYRIDREEYLQLLPQDCELI